MASYLVKIFRILYYTITVKLGANIELIFTDGSLEIFEVKYSSQLTRTKNLLEHRVRFL